MASTVCPAGRRGVGPVGHQVAGVAGQERDDPGQRGTVGGPFGFGLAGAATSWATVAGQLGQHRVQAGAAPVGGQQQRGTDQVTDRVIDRAGETAQRACGVLAAAQRGGQLPDRAGDRRRDGGGAVGQGVFRPRLAASMSASRRVQASSASSRAIRARAGRRDKIRGSANCGRVLVSRKLVPLQRPGSLLGVRGLRCSARPG
jgi:hypothetical protein